MQVEKTCWHLAKQVAMKIRTQARSLDEMHQGALSDQAQDVEIRRMQARCLFYLAFSDVPSDLEYVIHRYLTCENISIRLSALSALSHQAVGDDYLKHFWDHHAVGQPLLQIKWLALQSRSWRHGAVKKVRVIA